MKQIQFKDCRAHWNNNALWLENSKIARTVAIARGRCFTTRLCNKETGKNWAVAPEQGHDFSYSALLEDYERNPIRLHCAGIKGEIVSKNLYQHDCLKVSVFLDDPVQDLKLVREYFIYPGVAAIGARITLTSAVCPNFYNLIVKRIPRIITRPMENAVDSLRIGVKSLRMTCAEFTGRTDYANDLVTERKLDWNDKAERRELNGNVLFMQDPRDGEGIFFLQEAPPSHERRREGEGDFVLQGGMVKSCGWGILPHEFNDRPFASYLHVAGCFSKNTDHAHLEMKRYFNMRFKADPAKNFMTMANPWGGGGTRWYDIIGNRLIGKELNACREMGIEHYQIDDGWQEYRQLSELSVKNRSLNRNSWAVRRDIFPDQFKQIAAVSRECGTEICLWFAPSFNKRYRDWAAQANLLYELYKKYRIRIFKIDAMFAGSREAEENLRRLFSTLRERSKGEIYFNLDTTNGMRPGYFMFHEYGNIFLENRGQARKGPTQYFPWRTLGNLWSLSRYIPAQRLQIEFPDAQKAVKKIYEGEIYPASFSQEYITSISLFANPLFWGNPSECSAKAKAAIKKILALHKKHREEIFAGIIFPIGQKPTGYSWSGLQSHNTAKGAGFIAAYREFNKKDRYRFGLKFLNKCKIHLQCLSHDEEERTVPIGNNGALTLRLPEKNSFRLYRYSIARPLVF